MQYTDLKKQIKQNQLQNVYVLYGNERFVLLRVQQSLIEAAIGSGTAEWNFSRFDETAKPDQVHAACQTLPVFGPRRVVLVQDCPAFAAGDKADEAGWLHAVEQVPQETVLIFSLRYKPDGRKALTRALKSGMVVFDTLSEAEAIRFVLADGKRRGYVVDYQAVEQLLFNVGRDMAAVASEMEKAYAYASEDRHVTREVIETVGSHNVEADAFRITDLLLQGQMQRAQQMLDVFVQNGGALQMLLGAIVYRLGELLTAREALDAKKSEKQAAQLLKGPSFATARTVRQAKQYTQKRIVQAICALAQGDYLVKSGQMPERIALDMALSRAFGAQTR